MSDLDRERALAMELRGRLGGARAGLVDLKRALGAEDHDAILNAPGAKERAAKLTAAVREQEKSVAALARDLEREDAALAALVKADEVGKQEARMRDITVLASRWMGFAREFEALSARMGAVLKEHLLAGRALGVAIGTHDAVRLLGISGLVDRVAVCLYHDLTMPDERGEAEKSAVGHVAPLRFVPYGLPGHSAHYGRQFSVISQEIHDVIVRVFATEAEAREVVARIDPAGRNHHVLQKDGLWVIVKAAYRGEALHTGKNDEISK